MSGQPADSLIELLYDANPDINRIIDTFVSRFNAVYGDPAAARWDISKDEWQRYAFLGDRVLSLVIVQSLFTRREGALSKGKMTRILSSVVSNQALDALSRSYDQRVFTRLIPESIGEQETYGERITGGAFEAFIGALYCEVGLDDVTFFVLAVMKDLIDASNPLDNAIGLLQEYFQKKGGHPPIYEEMSRTGPDHRPHFTVRVRIADGRTFDGDGSTLPAARRDAAHKALGVLLDSR
jgi:ribonuclease III